MIRVTCFSVLLTALVSTSFAQKSLKEAYAGYFPVGVAVAPRNLTGPDAELIRTQFASLTPENAMKMGPIHPEPNRYFWQDADDIVAFAERNSMKVRGHTLCWHSQTPSWFFTGNDGKQVSRDVLLERLREHIQAVVSRYKGRIYAWDVVNEAVPDAGPAIYRPSKFLEIIGEDYIEKAFEFAHAADPDARLFYNDYNTESDSKRERIFQLLKKLKDKQIPVHGVGLQGHWSLQEPAAAALEESIRKFAGLGLEVQITELDVSVYPKEHVRRERRSTDGDVLTPEMTAAQTARYQMLFEVFRKYKGTLTGVTFWNVSDRTTWLDNFPVRGRKDYPLLFDQQGRPKESFYKVVNF